MTRPTRVLIVVAPYYSEIADMLVAGTKARLTEAGAEVDIREVAGALEIPLAIRIAAESDRYDGFVALGCVIRGETTHYETVANESARGLMAVGTSWGTPIGNGILTVENRDQAIVRADMARKNKGGEAADACLSLIALRREMGDADGSGADPREPTFLPETEHFDIAGGGDDPSRTT